MRLWRGWRLVIPVNDVIPTGYGYAYREQNRHAAVLFPIPFNHFARWGRSLWLATKIPKAGRWDVWFELGEQLGNLRSQNSALRQENDHLKGQLRSLAILGEIREQLRDLRRQAEVEEGRVP